MKKVIFVAVLVLFASQAFAAAPAADYASSGVVGGLEKIIITIVVCAIAFFLVLGLYCLVLVAVRGVITKEDNGEPDEYKIRPR